MAPATTQIKTNSKFYNIPLLNGDMEILANRITRDRDELSILNDQIALLLSNINTNSNNLLAMYIQQTGSFPDQSSNGRGSNGGGGGRDSE